MTRERTVDTAAVGQGTGYDHMAGFGLWVRGVHATLWSTSAYVLNSS
jgi:hypothetical protein